MEEAVLRWGWDGRPRRAIFLCRPSLTQFFFFPTPPPTFHARLIPSSARAGAGASTPVNPPPSPSKTALPRCRPRPSSPRRRRCVARETRRGALKSEQIEGGGAPTRGGWLHSTHRAHHGHCVDPSAELHRTVGGRGGGRAGRRAGERPIEQHGGSPRCVSPTPRAAAAVCTPCHPRRPRHSTHRPRDPAEAVFGGLTVPGMGVPFAEPALREGRRSAAPPPPPPHTHP